MMNYDQKYQSILDEYPEEITKEQLYKICHVSKKNGFALHSEWIDPLYLHRIENPEIQNQDD